MSEDYAIESMDTGLRLPILYNIVSSIFNIVLSLSYVIIVARVLPPMEFLAYSSIYTFYTFLTPLLTRGVQWSSRDYIRFGREAQPLFSGLYTLTIALGILIAPTLIHIFIYPLAMESFIVVLLYGVVIITHYYTLNLISLIVPRFYNLTSLISVLTRFTLLLFILFIYGSITFIVPLSVEVIGYFIGISSIFILTRGRISPSLFRPNKPSYKYILRVVKLSITNYVNMFRTNLGNIHYFIAFFMGLADILVNSLWIVYRVLNWGKSFFRGFFIVAYSRQFYRRMGGYDFTNYFNLLAYLIIPMFMLSIVVHRPITSLFNPKYMIYSPLIPIAILLVLLETLRITFLRVTFGGETIDKDMDDVEVKDILSTNFFMISFIQLKVMFISLLTLTITGIYFVLQGLTTYVPYLFLIFFVLEAFIEVILMYRRLSTHIDIKIDVSTILFLSLASIPSTIYLYYIKAYEIVVRDIFTDAIPLLFHISTSFLIYIAFSMLNGWSRRQLKGLIDYLVGGLK